MTNCSNNRTISQGDCTLFARYLCSTLCSWIIRVHICRTLYPPKDNPWVKLSLVRSKMLLPFYQKQYFEADKRQHSKVSKSYIFSYEPIPKISGFSQSQLATALVDPFQKSSVEIACFCSEFNAIDKPNCEKHLMSGPLFFWKRGMGNFKSSFMM